MEISIQRSSISSECQAKKTQSKDIVTGDNKDVKAVTEDSGDEGSRVVAVGSEVVKIEVDISGDVEDEINMTEIKSDFQAGSGVDDVSLESDLEGNESLQVEGIMALLNNLNDVREDRDWPLPNLSKTDSDKMKLVSQQKQETSLDKIRKWAERGE